MSVHPDLQDPAAGRGGQMATKNRQISLVAQAGHIEDATVPIDSHRWTGEVEAQRREGRMFVVLLILVVAVATPFAIWFALYLSRILLTPS